MSRTRMQKVVLGIAGTLYTIAAGCGLYAAVMHVKVEDDPLRGALVATALYLAGSGVLVQLGEKIVRGTTVANEAREEKSRQ